MTKAVSLLEREQELERLEEALANALDGDGKIVVIEGSAGIGKSSLLAAAAKRGPHPSGGSALK